MSTVLRYTYICSTGFLASKLGVFLCIGIANRFLHFTSLYARCFLVLLDVCLTTLLVKYFYIFLQIAKLVLLAVLLVYLLLC